MAGKGTVSDYVTLQRGITYKGSLVGKPGPALLGLGSIHPGGGFREGDYKTYGGECPPKLMLFPGDLFVSLKGATKDGKMIGSVARVPPSVPSGRLTQDTVKLEFCEKNPKTANFLYWILRTPQYRDYCDGRATGSAVVALSRDDFLDYPVPPITRLRLSIVELLEALDDKIELNRRMNATLEAMARALFQSWFVDFDPVRAKLDGRQPAGLDEATAALFPAAFQDSPLGEIPHGWQIGTLGELVQLRTDRVDATPAKDSTRYVALEDMPSKSIDLSKFQLGSAVNSSITAFRKGDVLFGSMRPYFHKVGLAFFDGITRTTTFVLRPRKDCFRHFALLYFFSDDVVAYSTTASVGTTIPYVRWDSMESYRIPIPPDPLLAEFEAMVSPLVQRIAAQGEESRTLATLRDTLLPKLLSGELSVANFEKELST